MVTPVAGPLFGWRCAACQSRLLREKKERQLEEWEEVVATHRWAHVRGMEEIRRRFEEISEQDKARAQREAEEERRREEQRRVEGGAGGVYRRIGEAQDTFVVDVPITEVGRAHHRVSMHTLAFSRFTPVCGGACC